MAVSHEVSDIELVSLGSILQAVVNSREVFNLAVRKKPPKIILFHNHSSGQLESSPQDTQITENIVTGGKTLTIDVLDHLIISEEGCFSFADNELLSSNKT